MSKLQIDPVATSKLKATLIQPKLMFLRPRSYQRQPRSVQAEAEGSKVKRKVQLREMQLG